MQLKAMGEPDYFEKLALKQKELEKRKIILLNKKSSPKRLPEPPKVLSKPKPKN